MPEEKNGGRGMNIDRYLGQTAAEESDYLLTSTFFHILGQVTILKLLVAGRNENIFGTRDIDMV